MQHGEADSSDLEFWREYLTGVPADLELPRDHRRPVRRNYRGASEPLAVSDALTIGLGELSHQAQVSLHTTLAASIAALLFRYTGAEDLLVGMADPGQEGVVLRADLAGQPSVLDLLKRTQEAGDVTRGHGGASCAAVLTELHHEADGEHHPLVQVRLLLGPAPPRPVRGESAPLGIPAPSVPCDLSVELDEGPSGLTGRFVYDRDLFEPATVRRMIGHWRMVLEGMVALPWCPVGELQLLGPEERRQLLSDWSTGPGLGSGPDIVTLIAEQARSRPDAVAATCEDQQLTYGQVNGRANQLARYLQELGVGPDVPVGLCLERSADHVIALLGVLKAGGAYVPLDPEAPAERIRYVLRDSRMPFLLTHERLQDKVGGTGASVVVLDHAWPDVAEHGIEELRTEPGGDQLAYVIYTSGSTGNPKGVMVERGALSAHCRAMGREYGLGPEDRVLQFGQYSADASLEQILPTLAAGGRLVMRGAELWPPLQLLHELTTRRVTVANLSPAHWYQAAQEWLRTGQGLEGLELRLVILGGERLGVQTVRQWRDLGLPGARLLNAYGPTEATITATLGEAGQERDVISIGRPLPGRCVYILDQAGEPVPAGVAGELHIGGPLLARGYLNRPELTAERFVPDRLGSQRDARLYRTGDLVRYLADGRIAYIGRRDDQVQIRGYRVELGEVEAVLGQHPAVDEAVVVARGYAGDVHLAAYIVTGASAVHDEAELRRYLAERLPRHMQPAGIARLASMPRLATGKPDRRRLPELEGEERSNGEPYLAPRTLAEEQLVRIWEELLEPRPIGISDNFFHLGGHSLLAGQLVDRIEHTFNKRMPISALFAGPTVEHLAAWLHEEGAAAARAQVLAVQAGGSRRPFFFLHGDWTGGAFYCFALARACGADQPFYVLEPCEFSSEGAAPTLEAIAKAHVASIREVQARGPYRLGGFCNGGLLAYEMARQLEEEGDEVEFLGLINPSEPVQSSVLRTALDGVRSIGGDRSEGPADLYLRARHAMRHVYRRLRPHDSRVADFGKLLAIEPRLERPFPTRDALYGDYVGVFSWAAAAHRAGIYGGKITFFWAREEPTIAASWWPIVRDKDGSDIEEHSVDGTHMSCVTDGIDGLAVALGECLTRLERGRGTDGHDGSRSTRGGHTTGGVVVRQLRGPDVRAVVGLERRAFPRDPWTTTTAGGWLVRSRVGSHPQGAHLAEQLIRLFRITQVISLIRLARLVSFGLPAGSSCVVAEADGTIVGYAFLEAVPPGKGEIQMIAVEPGHQGRGIGQALLATVMETAASRGCTGASLFVRVDNLRARQLYRYIGFTELGNLAGYYQPSGTDAIMMGLDFTGPATTR